MTPPYRPAIPDGIARTAAKDEITPPNGILVAPPASNGAETRANHLLARHAGGVRPAAAACPWGAPSNYETVSRLGEVNAYTTLIPPLSTNAHMSYRVGHTVNLDKTVALIALAFAAGFGTALILSRMWYVRLLFIVMACSMLLAIPLDSTQSITIGHVITRALEGLT